MPASRLLLPAALCLLGGAAATVLVAWGFALWGVGHIVEQDAILLDPEDRHVPSLTRAVLRRFSIPDSAEVIGGIRTFRGVGTSDVVASATYYTPSVRGSFLLETHSTGWPFVALECDRSDVTPGSEPMVWRGAADIPRWIARGTYEAPFLNLHSVRPPLPLRPLPLNFTLDTLFYAAILATLSLVPPRLRRALRLRRNLCPSCAYNLTGNTTGICPECGSAHPLLRPKGARS